MHTCIKPVKQTGIALVIVLWMMVLLTIMAASYSASMRTETMMTAHQLQTAQARALAEAGVWLALKELLKPELERSWETDGSTQTLQYGKGKINISIQDEAGKIDLNTARPELLQSLLQTDDAEHVNTDELLHAILDWRDRDDLRRESGAEDREYRAAGLGYEAKDGPFNSIDELRLVLGMTEVLFQKIQSTLTIHSHQPGINPDVAPKEVLVAISNINPESIDEFLVNRRKDKESNSSSSLIDVDNRFISRSKGRSFTITSEGMIADSKLRLDAVVLLKINVKPPFSVLSWSEAKPGKQIKANTHK